MDLRFGKGVRQVTVVEKDSAGKRTTTTIYRRSKSKKKSTFSTFDKMVRAASSSIREFGDNYRERHDKSNEQKADGWLRDLPYNVYRASRQAGKKFRVLPIPVPYTVIEEEGEEEEEEEEDDDMC